MHINNKTYDLTRVQKRKLTNSNTLQIRFRENFKPPQKGKGYNHDIALVNWDKGTQLKNHSPWALRYRFHCKTVKSEKVTPSINFCAFCLFSVLAFCF